MSHLTGGLILKVPIVGSTCDSSCPPHTHACLVWIRLGSHGGIGSGFCAEIFRVGKKAM